MSRLSALSIGQLGRKSLAALSARLFGAAAGFAFQVVLARLLGAEEAGIYALALTLSLIASVVGRAGMDSAVLKYGASAYSVNDALTLATVQRSILSRVLPLSIALAALGVTVAPWLADAVFGNAGLTRPMRWMFASVPMLSLATLYAELLRAADRHVTAALLQGACIPVINLSLIVLMAPHIHGAVDMAALYFTATAVMVIAGRLIWARVTKDAAVATADRGTSIVPVTEALVFATGLRMFPAAMAGILMAWVDILLLGIWTTSDQVGIYNAAVRTALLSSFMLLAINSVVAPRFAASALHDKVGATAQLARRACLLSLLATAPILTVFLVFSEKVLLIFGPQFAAGSTALVIVAAGQMVNAATGPVGHLLNMRGFHADESRISMAAVVLNVGLCVWLIPKYGVTGAALSNALAVATCNLARVGMVRARLRFWIYPGL